MTTVSFNPASTNRKTGNIPVSRSERQTCPKTCPFYDKGCYAKYGPEGMHWRDMENNKKVLSWDEFCKKIESLTNNQLWRHNSAGDLPHNDGNINYLELKKLIVANKGKKGFTYSHHELNDHNLVCLENANMMGFTVNVSTQSVEDADKVMTDHKLPAVSVVNSSKTERFYITSSGRKVITCPAIIHDNVSCATCGLCQQSERDFIIAFPAHGTAKKTVNEIVSNWE